MTIPISPEPPATPINLEVERPKPPTPRDLVQFDKELAAYDLETAFQRSKLAKLSADLEDGLRSVREGATLILYDGLPCLPYSGVVEALRDRPEDPAQEEGVGPGAPRRTLYDLVVTDLDPPPRPPCSMCGERPGECFCPVCRARCCSARCMTAHAAWHIN